MHPPFLSPRSCSTLQSSARCDIEKEEGGGLIQFSVARWQRARGRRPGIIRLKFQRYLRRSIFSAPTHIGLSERRVAYDGANIRRLTRKSLIPVHRLSFILRKIQKKNRLCRANLDDQQINANKRNFHEEYFNNKKYIMFRKTETHIVHIYNMRDSTIKIVDILFFSIISLYPSV